MRTASIYARKKMKSLLSGLGGAFKLCICEESPSDGIECSDFMSELVDVGMSVARNSVWPFPSTTFIKNSISLKCAMYIHSSKTACKTYVGYVNS